VSHPPGNPLDTRPATWLESGLDAGAHATVHALARAWQRDGRLCIEPVLAPGLAAELAAFVPQLELTPHWDAERALLSWRCLVGMPAVFEPQYPMCMYRLGHALAHELPRLVSSIVGHRVMAQEPRYIDIRVLRKGSYRDALPSPSPPVDIEFMISLTGARFPPAWGGHIEFLDGRQAVIESREPGWDTLHLMRPSGARIPLMTHHVWTVMVIGTLVAEPAHEGRHAP
jgi:hypothetical protein